MKFLKRKLVPDLYEDEIVYILGRIGLSRGSHVGRYYAASHVVVHSGGAGGRREEGVEVVL